MKQSHKSTPTISVVMPLYNCAAFVAEAIESILVQSFADFEFIIVDDGSTDGTPDTIRDYARQDKRIRPFFLEHSYAARATNIGVQHARGQWFARMDADDISLPHRLETELAWIKSTGVDVCGSQAGLFGKREGVLWFPEDHDAMQRELLFRICLPHPAVIMAYPY